MHTKLFFFITVLLLNLHLNAQVGYTLDSISLNGNNDIVYYSLEGGNKIVKTKKNWDIGFANEKHESSIRINDLKGVRLWKTNKDTANFNAVTLSDTTTEKFNSPSYMLQGAFDMQYKVLNANNDYQIGWGIMYLSLGNIMNGDTVFIIKGIDNVYRKMYVKYRISPERRYIVRIANIDNTNNHEWIVKKNFDSTTTYGSYYSLTNETIVPDIETNFNSYDLIFRDYVVNNTKYPMGVLTNNSFSLLNNLKAFNGQTVYQNFKYITVPAYEVPSTPIASANYNGSLIADTNFTLNNAIGINWLNTSNNTAKADESFFIRDRKGCVWHFAVKEYKSASNEIVFYRKKLNTCYNAIFDAKRQPIPGITIFPNPILNGDPLKIDNPERQSIHYSIRNLEGKLIQEGDVSHSVEIETNTLKQGLYLITVTDKKFNQTIEKVIIE